MKTLKIFALSILLYCQCNSKHAVKVQNDPAPSYSGTKVYQHILDSAQVEGAILLYDLTKNTYHSNDFDWAKKGWIPASTFKITNSIIALETGVVKDDSTFFPWDGKPRSLPVWEQDLYLRDAFHYSCVPCYQQIARKIGVRRMNTYLNSLNYGHMIVDSSSLDMFWLKGESKISQEEQINFLVRLHKSQLPISTRTETIMKRMMVIENKNGYTLRGKTGWSQYQGKQVGWFVGYAEGKNGVYFFATNINPREGFDVETFGNARKAVTFAALKRFGVDF